MNYNIKEEEEVNPLYYSHYETAGELMERPVS